MKLGAFKGTPETKCHPGAPEASAPQSLSQTPRAHDGEELATVRRAVTVCEVSAARSVCPDGDSGKCRREMCSLLEK